MTDQSMTRDDMLFNMLTSKAKPAPQSANKTLSILASRIREFGFIPFVSDTLFLEQIFAQLIERFRSSGGQASKLSVEDILARSWAKEIGYPISDRASLAQVAQYHIVSSKFDRSIDAQEAKKEYLLFLKQVLLNFAQNLLGVDEEIIAEQTASINTSSFTDIVTELDLPRREANQTNPLQILASLPIPIYMTTSPFLFMEQALEKADKHPCTQICQWSGNIPNLDPRYEYDPAYRPDANNPLVYHLYGLEKYTNTLVLGEDDYLEFLTRVTQDTDTTHPLIPLTVRSPLPYSSLVMLGYRLEDWDCRVLLRGLLYSGELRKTENRPKSVVLQLTPDQQNQISTDDMAVKYLEYYFKMVSFDVEWTSTTDFLEKLQAEYKKGG